MQLKIGCSYIFIGTKETPGSNTGAFPHPSGGGLLDFYLNLLPYPDVQMHVTDMDDRYAMTVATDR